MAPTLEQPRWELILPQLALGLSMLGILAQELLGKAGQRSARAWWLAMAGTSLALLLVTLGPSEASPGFGGMVVHDGLFRISAFAILLSLLAGLTLARRFLEQTGSPHRSEIFALLLASGLGMLLMASSVHLAMIFLGLELFSLALYLLCLAPFTRPGAQEAALKYFFLSSLASALLLFGMALVYGGSNSLALSDLRGVALGGPGDALLLAGMAMMAAGLCFKLGIVPFHSWAPEVYLGAPTPVTTFMSVGTKAAVLITWVRLFPLGLADRLPQGQEALALLAGITILVGNLGALGTRNFKKMLAWSGVAHAGYLLIAPICLASESPRADRALTALLAYLVVYAFTNLGAFAVVSWLEGEDGLGMDREALTGLASRRPALAGAISVLMLSLAGIPPTGGFFVKFALFGAALSSGWASLAVVGALGSLVGAAYYIRIVALMVRADEGLALPALDRGTAAVLGLGAVGALGSGLGVQWLLDLAAQATRMATG